MIMARTFLWLGWLMRIYRELFARQIKDSHPRIHPSIDPSIVLLNYLPIRLLALFLLFWLGSATGHRPHTPTTIPFQYVPLIEKLFRPILPVLICIINELHLGNLS